MVYRPLGSQPARGSTEWGARQFYRLLDDEEHMAAERKRLLAMGWRPRQPASRNPAHPASRNGFLLEMVSDAHARAGSVRRTNAAQGHLLPTTSSSSPVRQVRQAGDGFDWYKLYCALDPQSCILGQVFRGDAGSSGGCCPEPDCDEVRQECHEECVPLSLGNGSDSPLVYRRCVRDCMVDQGCFDF